MKKTVAVLGTFDTKGEEFSYLSEKIKALGVNVLTIDAGTGKHAFSVDVTNDAVAKWGGRSIEDLAHDRSAAMESMSAGAKACVLDLYANKRIQGIISMGGSGGTTIGTSAMNALPVGFPKVMVSTVAASAKIFDYVECNDIFFVNSIVDVSGLNSVIRKIYDEAAGAIAGAVLAAAPADDTHEKLRIAATMYGVTTPGVSAAKKYLEEKGYEVITFHCTGAGGKVMERLIREGFFDGVLDMTQTEIGMYVFGDTRISSGPDRASGAALMGLPCISCLGAMDMCSLGSLSTEGKKLYYHNGKTPSHFRPNTQECEAAASFLAGQLNKATQSQRVIIPLKGLSMMDREGNPTYGPEDDKALFSELKKCINNPHITIEEYDLDINHPEFALLVGARMDEMMKEKYGNKQ